MAFGLLALSRLWRSGPFTPLIANCCFIYIKWKRPSPIYLTVSVDCSTVSLGSMTPADHEDPPSSPFHLINHDQIQEDQPQFFTSANHASSSVSSPSFCTVIRDHRGARVPEVSPNDYENGTQNLHMAGSSNHQMYSTAALPDMDENISSVVCGHNLALHKYKLEEEYQTNISSSAQWMPSKMRLVHRMMTANRAAADKPIKNFPRVVQNQQVGCSEINTDSSSASSDTVNNNTTRVCSDCNTTTTPLWRSGPRGPKSLCNACGIRQRKQRKAMSEASATAANGFKGIMHSKEKKPRSAATSTAACTSQGDDHQRLLSFNDFKLSWSIHNSASQQVFPQDEVAEAAILLMELSCGFLHV